MSKLSVTMRSVLFKGIYKLKWLLLGNILCSCGTADAGFFSARRPLVRIFILAGDDNVEGYASIPQLHDLATHSDTREAYQHWLQEDGKQWKVRDDVFVSYDHERDKDWLHGPLTVKGFGAKPNTFGPEVEFGHVLGDIFDEPVILLKAGWSHRSLDKDFRAPWDTQSGGFQWFRLMSSLKQTIENLETILGPEYKHARHQVSGLVWWHGYSDFEKGAVRNYGENLENLLKALRSEITLFLPIAVAELGGQGTVEVSSEELAFREMQQSVVDHPYLKRTTVFVPTSTYVVKASDADLDAQEIDTYQHYYGRADTMMAIGHALAVAIAEQTAEGAQKLHAASKTAEISGLHDTSAFEIFLLAAVGMAVVAIVVTLAIRRGGFFWNDLKRLQVMIMTPFRPPGKSRDFVVRGGEIETRTLIGNTQDTT
jgi:hypothetical protein